MLEPETIGLGTWAGGGVGVSGQTLGLVFNLSLLFLIYL